MTSQAVILTPDKCIMGSDKIVTLYNSKPFDGVNKLYCISKNPSFGLMYHGNGYFGSKKVEVLVEEFNNNLDSTSIKSVRDVFEEFIKFLEKNTEPDDVEMIIKNYYQEFVGNLKEVFENLDTFQIKSFIKYQDKSDVLTFIKDYNISFDDILPDNASEDDLDNLNNELLKMFSQQIIDGGTGIVIAGFDISNSHPSIINSNLIINNNGKIEYQVNLEEKNYDNSNIFLFAISNEAKAFINGINPKFLTELFIFNEILWKTNIDYLFNQLTRDFDEKTSNEIKTKLIEYENEFIDDNRFYKHVIRSQEDFRSLILNILPFIPENFLIDLTELLIYLNSSKLKFSVFPNSVGSESDICLILKKEFKWKKLIEKS